MARRAAGRRSGGPPDQLTQFAQALTGAHYFVPSAERLAAFGDDATGASS